MFESFWISENKCGWKWWTQTELIKLLIVTKQYRLGFNFLKFKKKHQMWGKMMNWKLVIKAPRWSLTILAVFDFRNFEISKKNQMCLEMMNSNLVIKALCRSITIYAFFSFFCWKFRKQIWLKIMNSNLDIKASCRSLQLELFFFWKFRKQLWLEMMNLNLVIVAPLWT